MAVELEPQLVTMDIDMPVMDGVDATRHIAPLGVSVVVLTGSDEKDRVGDAIAAGAVASRTKSDAVHSLPTLLRAVHHAY